MYMKILVLFFLSFVLFISPSLLCAPSIPEEFIYAAPEWEGPVYWQYRGLLLFVIRRSVRQRQAKDADLFMICSGLNWPHWTLSLRGRDTCSWGHGSAWPPRSLQTTSLSPAWLAWVYSSVLIQYCLQRLLSSWYSHPHCGRHGSSHNGALCKFFSLYRIFP